MLEAMNLLALYMSKNVNALLDLFWSPQDYNTAHVWRSFGNLRYQFMPFPFFETGSLITHRSFYPSCKFSKIPIPASHIPTGTQRLERPVILSPGCTCILRISTLATDSSPQPPESSLYILLGMRQALLMYKFISCNEKKLFVWWGID